MTTVGTPPTREMLPEPSATGVEPTTVLTTEKLTDPVICESMPGLADPTVAVTCVRSLYCTVAGVTDSDVIDVAAFTTRKLIGLPGPSARVPEVARIVIGPGMSPVTVSVATPPAAVALPLRPLTVPVPAGLAEATVAVEPLS